LALRRENPNSRIGVFGCGVKVDAEGYKAFNGVDFVCSDFKEVVSYIKNLDCESFGSRVGLGEDLLRTREVLKFRMGAIISARIASFRLRADVREVFQLLIFFRMLSGWFRMESKKSF
jgi:hypothetical protein